MPVLSPGTQAQTVGVQKTAQHAGGKTKSPDNAVGKGLEP